MIWLVLSGLFLFKLKPVGKWIVDNRLLARLEQSLAVVLESIRTIFDALPCESRWSVRARMTARAISFTVVTPVHLIFKPGGSTIGGASVRSSFREGAGTKLSTLYLRIEQCGQQPVGGSRMRQEDLHRPITT